MSRTGARDKARRQLTETLAVLTQAVLLLSKSRVVLTCMPRSASRITLEITDIRTERLRDLNPEQAVSEGLVSDRNNYWEVNPWGWVVELKQVKQ
ncbi:hypothetical protein OX90_06925 [Pseudomonas coronafaciens pv. porri]|uniref:Uncharacterized protein n=1 Tax=Pseudomonas coronafaciens pv. porri TaxID=83964 RepID=A0ABR5JRY6_9PSED|nr:hypothetical protein [Pseudomonas coronafaciens]KOP57851.1 hypothetical protein OX88_04080 [Pseudomonas coronafaciens pv. porri]KOP60274.1 hypothetical protein OX90_06925 [Pseudomonas coronafaciens pv. porri]